MIMAVPERWRVLYPITCRHVLIVYKAALEINKYICNMFTYNMSLDFLKPLSYLTKYNKMMIVQTNDKIPQMAP